jgi:putative FmdB family regulatory protein
MIYLYQCLKHGMFEVSKSMANAPLPEACPECGQQAQRKYVGLPFSFGFKLSDRSHERFGPRDEFVRDV